MARSAPHFAAQAGRFERLFDDRGDVVEVERLVGEVIRAELHRLDRGVDAGVGREQDDERVGIELLQLAQDGDAVEIGQLVVEQHQIDALAAVLERLRRRSPLPAPRSPRRAGARRATSGSAARRRRPRWWRWLAPAQYMGSRPTFCGTSGERAFTENEGPLLGGFTNRERRWAMPNAAATGRRRHRPQSKQKRAPQPLRTTPGALAVARLHDRRVRRLFSAVAA